MPVALGRTFGQQLLEALGMNDRKDVERIIITVEANDIVRIRLTIIGMVEQTTAITHIFENYVLAPDETVE